MRNWLKEAAAWQVGVCCGGLFGVLFGLGLRYPMGKTWTVALLSAALGAPVFGVSMALMARRERQLMAPFREMNLTARQQRAAQRAMLRGPVPDDPAVRLAAAELTRVQLGRLGARWFRVLATGLLVLEVASLVLQVLGGERWTSMVLPAAGAVLFGSGLLWPRLLRRRLEVLSGAVPEVDPTTD